MKKKLGMLFSLGLLVTASSSVFATSYPMPPTTQSLIGTVDVINAEDQDNVVNLAARYDIGFNTIQNANPQLDMKRGFPINAPVVISTEHILPNVPRVGIVVNLPEMRLYYYPENSQTVLTYPIGIGKIGKTIPIIDTAIAYKRENPTWTPPEDIREFNLQQGVVLPKVMPPGPDNPLGKYAIYMKIPTYLMHSTIFPESIGTRASFGCLRMYESDIEGFFPTITPGIPVEILNMPTKVGWQNDFLYMEVNPPLEEHQNEMEATIPGMVHRIVEITANQPTLVDWQAVSFIAKEKDGIPHSVGFAINHS